MRLSEIDAEIEGLLARGVDPETGEITDECMANLEALEIERERKLLDIAVYMMGEEAEAKAVEEHAKAMATRARTHRNRATRLRRFLSEQIPNGSKLRDDRVRISWRNSERVDVDEDADLPERFLRRPPPAPDKTALRNALKSGQEIPGARLLSGASIQIKP